MNGAWIAPVDFIGAQKIPTQMLNFFFEMDSLVAKLAKQEKGK